MPENVFEGLKVADFSWVQVGPLVTKYLADYGATVVKIESMAHPDITRTSAPFKDEKPGVNRASYFAYYSCNKLSLALNLNHPKALDVAKRLVQWSDVVVENFAPGMMERWGLGYEELKKIKPDIIMLRISNQGQTGPHSRIASYGLMLVPMAGFSQLIGWPDRDPLTLNFAWPDYIVPQFALTALIATLEYRRRTGKGQLLDLSQLEASLYFLLPPILDYTANNRESMRMGNSCPFAAPHGVFRCQGEDRWCAIAAFTDEEWASLCKAMGNPLWSKGERVSSMMSRKQNEAELNERIEAWTIHFAPEEVMSRLQREGVSAGIVANIADLHKDAQLRYRNHFWMVNHPEIGQMTCLGQPSILSLTPAQLRRPAPLLGQDTVYVCHKLLGMPDAEFDELVVSGVFG
ncbi:CaiB/BaiF CoA transferase family protein [Chloroflexota bacterium]